MVEISSTSDYEEEEEEEEAMFGSLASLSKLKRLDVDAVTSMGASVDGDIDSTARRSWMASVCACQWPSNTSQFESAAQPY